jgi:hypothetical protein
LTLTDSLEATFHFRITYPWQKKNKNGFINNLRYFLPILAIGFGLIAIVGSGGGGGYICASANSLTGFCKIENVFAMTDAVKKHGIYPLNLD